MVAPSQGLTKTQKSKLKPRKPREKETEKVKEIFDPLNLPSCKNDQIPIEEDDDDKYEKEEKLLSEARSSDSESDDEPSSVGEELEQELETSTTTTPRPDGDGRPLRHIHPCVCDLSPSARRRIEEHKKIEERAQNKFRARIKSIEDHVRMMEEERAEKERLKREQEDLFADEYEMVGHKKKRKKRSARRASMVSLGVKQVINSTREPKIKVKYNMATQLRCRLHRPCGKYPFAPSPVYTPDYRRIPRIPVRIPKFREIQHELSKAKVKKFYDTEDKRPPFLVAFFPPLPV